MNTESSETISCQLTQRAFAPTKESSHDRSLILERWNISSIDLHFIDDALRARIGTDFYNYALRPGGRHATLERHPKPF